MDSYALITGASSGIGREVAKCLAKRGFNLVLVARRLDRLDKLKEELISKGFKGDIINIKLDLSKEENILALYKKLEGRDIEILINNAGFGDLGKFTNTEISKEVKMIDVNVRALHLLTKLFLKDMVKKDRGYILNVASVAGLLPGGPYMATYYATKAYAKSLTLSIAGELKREGSKVYIGALCPGPVDTEFNEVANCKFALKGLDAKTCARIGVRGMFKKKSLIIPGKVVKASMIMAKHLPRQVLLRFCASQQCKKG